jgi:EpsI family protein
MRNSRLIALFVFLCLQALWVTFASTREYLPPTPDLTRFDPHLGNWNFESESPLEPGILKILHADSVLSRYYAETGTPWRAQILVAWFQTQRSGRTQPHSPKVCLPSAGWLPVKSDTLRIGDLEVNRYIAGGNSGRGVILYWYQTAFHAQTSEWAAKLQLTADALRYHRTDGALIRFFVPIAAGSDDEASAAAVRFVQAARPALDRRLPR